MKRNTIQMQCPKCERGTLTQNGYVVGTYPAKYGHVCPLCSHQEILERPYPYTYDELEPHEQETRTVKMEEK